MRLTSALRLGPGCIVAFTGAGGKSAALATLAREANSRMPLIATTTTRLAASQAALAQTHLVNPEPAGLRTALRDRSSILITGPRLEVEEKWTAVRAELLGDVADLARRSGAVLAIEADGARGRWVKAPGPREPVVPEWVDMVVPVMNLKALGRPLTSDVAHRPELVADVLGIKPGDPLDERCLVDLLISPRGGLKGIPGGAEARVFLTGAEDAAAMEAAGRIAAAVLRTSSVRAVMIGGPQESDPVRELHGRVAGVVLAAGAGTRLGRSKPLVVWKGEPLVVHVVRSAREAGLDPIAVVVGAEAAKVREAVAGEEVQVVENPGWNEGQSTSVRLGVQAIEQVAEAGVFLLSDMPRVRPATLRGLVERHRKTVAGAVAPVGGGRRGNPVLFDRSLFPELTVLTGDQGGRPLLETVAWEAVPTDPDEFFEVDDSADLEALERLT